MNTFERVKQLCAKRHLTLVQVNDRAGMGKNSIYSWKTSKPAWKIYKKLLRYCILQPTIYWEILMMQLNYIKKKSNLCF